ncbi:prepilin-type N-terminal cleavage/methylation domain-containing protein [Desulfonauticus submarinus]
MKKLKTQNQGFTLVELAIVLVIIGIILGAVLKGQELIFNSKVKRLQNQVKEMQAAFYTYYDKYGVYPGDDPKDRWGIGTTGNGNGRVGGGYCTAANEESCLLWRHLRYANIITGDPTDNNPSTLVPKHIFGGPLDMFSGTYTIGGQSRSGLWITLRQVEAEAAAALDRLVDDGKCATGSMARYGGTHCTQSGDYPSTGYLDVWINF